MTEKSFLLTVNTELKLIPFGTGTRRTLEITIHPPAAAQNKPRPRLNLALVLDRSGSMSGDKLDYAKAAAAHLVSQLREEDRAAVVAYDDEVNLVQPSTPVTPPMRERLNSAIAAIRTGGSTNLGEGWLTGCRQAAQHQAEGSLSRTLLLTDGLANVGITSLEVLAVHARNLAREGVSTSTFGVGTDYDEHLLEAMATAGGGNYYFIQTPQDIARIFAEEFSGLAAVSMRDVELTLRLPAGASARVLGSWAVEQHAQGLRLPVGALQAGKPQAIYVDVDLPSSPLQSQLLVECQLLGRGEAGQLFDESVGLRFECADPLSVESAPVDRALLQRAAQVRLADAANEAHKLERAGHNQQASDLLKAAVLACQSILDSAELEKYIQLAERMRRGRDEYNQKLSHSGLYQSRRSRT